MNKARAASAALVGLALTATAAVAAAAPTQKPANPAPISTLAQDKNAVGGPNANHGGAVSALARSFHGPDVTSTEPAAPDTTDAAANAHGVAVSAVAQDLTAVGGTNDNHGGAVSAVARGTHGPAAVHGKSAEKGQAGTPTH
jgi:hypothetical protein